LDAIYRYSGGIPRLINVVGDNALLTSYAMERKQVDESIIREVAQDLSLSTRTIGGGDVSRNAEMPTANGATPRTLATVAGGHVSPMSPRIKQNMHDTTAGSGVAIKETYVSAGLFDTLRIELIEAMGPMACIVIEERVRKLGYTMRGFPEQNWGSLIESVSEEILEPSMRKRFQQSLARRVPVLRPHERNQ
jgi:hypothetical protein